MTFRGGGARPDDKWRSFITLYAFICEDAPGTLDKRLATRPVHLARLNELNEAGRLFVAGAFPAIDSADPGPAGFTGQPFMKFN